MKKRIANTVLITIAILMLAACGSKESETVTNDIDSVVNTKEEVAEITDVTEAKPEVEETKDLETKDETNSVVSGQMTDYVIGTDIAATDFERYPANNDFIISIKLPEIIDEQTNGPVTYYYFEYNGVPLYVRVDATTAIPKQKEKNAAKWAEYYWEEISSYTIEYYNTASGSGKIQVCDTQNDVGYLIYIDYSYDVEKEYGDRAVEAAGSCFRETVDYIKSQLGV